MLFFVFVGIPGSKVDFLRFVQAVKKLRESIEGPIAAHCRLAAHVLLCIKTYCLCMLFSHNAHCNAIQCWHWSNWCVYANGNRSMQNGGSGAYLSSGGCAYHERPERDACADSSEYCCGTC